MSEIRRLRESVNWKQRHLAAATGWPISTISKLENGKQPIKNYHILSIRRAVAEERERLKQAETVDAG